MPDAGTDIEATRTTGRPGISRPTEDRHFDRRQRPAFVYETVGKAFVIGRGPLMPGHRQARGHPCRPTSSRRPTVICLLLGILAAASAQHSQKHSPHHTPSPSGPTSSAVETTVDRTTLAEDGEADRLSRPAGDKQRATSTAVDAQICARAHRPGLEHQGAHTRTPSPATHSLILTHKMPQPGSSRGKQCDAPPTADRHSNP